MHLFNFTLWFLTFFNVISILTSFISIISQSSILLKVQSKKALSLSLFSGPLSSLCSDLSKTHFKVSNACLLFARNVIYPSLPPLVSFAKRFFLTNSPMSILSCKVFVHVHLFTATSPISDCCSLSRIISSFS